MRRYTALLAIAGLAACQKAEKPAEQPVAPAAAPAPAAPAPINLADVAGKWTVKSMPEGKDTVLVTYTLTATADTNGWTVSFPGRKPIAMKVSASGDSIMTWVGPYESMLRKGKMVSTNGAFHIVGGKLVGHQTAHYAQKEADSVLALRSEGEKTP